MKLTSFSCQVRTAPSPSQSPFAEGGKLLPGEVRAPMREEEEREEGAKVASGVGGREEKLVEQKKNLAAEEDKKEAVKEQEQSKQLEKDGEPDSPQTQVRTRVLFLGDRSPHQSLLPQKPPVHIP